MSKGRFPSHRKGMDMRTRIIGTGSCLPAFRADNHWIAAQVETSDEWIRERTGIIARRLAGGEVRSETQRKEIQWKETQRKETTSGLAAEAGRRALEDAGLRAEELDLILVATVSPDCFVPSAACMVQAALGAVHAVAFDLNAACSGFLFGLHTADAYIRSGFCQNALVIGSEVLSKLVDWKDRSTCILFGDGAGAAVVRGDGSGILGQRLGSDGSRGSVLTCGARENRNPLLAAAAKTAGQEAGEVAETIRMDGQEVFRFAVRTVPACIEGLLAECGVEKREISCYLLHQANYRILQSVARRLREPEEKFPMNLEECGNTSSASLGILLDEVNRSGRLKRGDKIVLSGFGAGLTWGALLLEW